MSKDTLIRRICNPRIELYSCGRRDIEAGVIDRRVLAALEFLASSGLKRRSRRCVAATASTRRQATCRHTRPATRSTSRRSTGSRSWATRARARSRTSRCAACSACRARCRAPDHHPDDLRGRDEHARDGRSRRSHPSRLPPAVRSDDEGRQDRRVRPEAVAVDQADRPPRRGSTTRRCSCSRRSTRSRRRSGARAAPTRASGNVRASVRNRRDFRVAAVPLAQFEFSWLLGPESGRHSVRERLASRRVRARARRAGRAAARSCHAGDGRAPSIRRRSRSPS